MKTLIIVAGALVLGASVAQAGSGGTGTGHAGRTAVTAAALQQATTPAYYDMGGGYGGQMYGDIATTPIQGIDYGIAKIIRAEADYNFLTSQALLTMTQVQRQRLENWRQASVTYYELRRLNDEYRKSQQGRQLTSAELAQIAQAAKPRRLTPSELDTISGQIVWPIVLQAVEFAPLREQANQVFVERATHGVLGLDQYLSGDRVLAQMLDLLRKQIHDVPGHDYMGARRFLESLAYELRFPAI